MATMTGGGWFANLLSRSRPKIKTVPHSRKVREFSKRVYEETGGATPELKQLMTTYLTNKKSRQGLE